jgi:predicted Ser/Thr protein kinase
MEESGAEAILKMLEKNYKIEYLGIEKLQFSQHIRSKIQHKMEENKGLRQR